ncbi:competence/damage-inducible protein cinA [Haladaptatus litoreus]|uniref:Competence/damage-inducible protein cinA n=1 Tax=Haladaptatus litoreus TaxID=553468 RepID=A0A1N6XZJ8_9EURY|nr:molybdopterin-binding protein [Haladaptatus litoreus]SIR07812.1 competence/damage-inducible protein cinA [Haladaptatus litoreus]
MQIALISVGDEILSGDTVNTNAAWLGKQLTERGVSVERVFVVPDHVADIARVVNESLAEYDAVIVTGGLGPTHDDLTMEGVAAAVGVPVEEHTEAVEWIETHSDYSHADLVSGTTHLPKGSRMLPNEVGVAPGAAIENIYVLPGVPEEMKAMFERIEDEFDGDPYFREVVPADEPESALIDRFEELRERFDVKVGSYPGDHVRVKIEGSDEEVVQNAADWLRQRVERP